MSTKIELARQYRPSQVEPMINERWQNAKAFHAEPASSTDPRCRAYAIVIPPPNVTAALHMGHALNNTLQDILIRFHRMLGDNTMWMPGTDHAGIATQTIVEKRVLQEEGKRRTDFNRDEFVARIQNWKDEYELTITNQLKAMGCSCDWDRQRFTMDPVCARAVREAFFRLFQDGLIYRGKRLVNWDPVTQTALADDEVELQQIDGHFYYLRYPLIGPPLPDGSNFVTVATTRPETMLGDTAVAVNPADPRAMLLRGRLVLLPIVNREIAIIEDDYVALPDPKSNDPKAKFATGFLKVTPAHDPHDWEIGRRHGLDITNVLAPDGTISRDHGWPEHEWGNDPSNTNEAGFLLGLDRFEAREAVVAFFKQHGMLEDIKPYRHAVGHSYRSHVPIEPYLSDQWYVKVTTDRLASAALRAMADDQRSESSGCGWKGGGQSDEGETERHEGTVAPRRSRDRLQHEGGEDADWEGKLRFFPARYARTFQAWHENIRDWCISRQLWWGHRIPVWSAPGSPGQTSRESEDSEFLSKVHAWESDGRIVHQGSGRRVSRSDVPEHEHGSFICVKNDDDQEVINFIESHGYVRDPDVLDTWFSSALWPLSTMGWPEETELLKTWNPTNVLCTAREIITLWVSRMVMFNLYFRGTLPFHDVFIHAMIQDSHGQKMSKSMGNGVDPMDIIHSHGADAMRFTLASMTTHTQDVRLPVDMVCPHTNQTFTPKFFTTMAGHHVAAPVQDSPRDRKKKMVSSYGVASGEAQSTAQTPVARNTSAKFDLGRNFANKLWNAVRFALTNLEGVDRPFSPTPESRIPIPELADRWILSRLAQAVTSADQAITAYEFASYANGLYHFIWRDLCDWYIEAVKPTVQANPHQQRVLAACIDVSLRLLHPTMPFITERLWETLNDVVSQRAVDGILIPPSKLLINAAWPKVDLGLVVAEAEQTFEQLQNVVGAARQARTLHKIPPRQKVDCAIKAPSRTVQLFRDHQDLIQTLAGLRILQINPDVEKPADAAVSVVGEVELYLHGLIDKGTEMQRLQKRADELAKEVRTMQGRLSNENYLKKAPAHLVEETRNQLALAKQEADSVEKQLTSLGG